MNFKILHLKILMLLDFLICGSRLFHCYGRGEKGVFKKVIEPFKESQISQKLLLITTLILLMEVNIWLKIPTSLLYFFN